MRIHAQSDQEMALIPELKVLSGTDSGTDVVVST